MPILTILSNSSLVPRPSPSFPLLALCLTVLQVTGSWALAVCLTVLQAMGSWARAWNANITTAHTWSRKIVFVRVNVDVVDSVTQATSVWYWQLLYTRWGVWSWDIICTLWLVNSGENTDHTLTALYSSWIFKHNYTNFKKSPISVLLEM